MEHNFEFKTKSFHTLLFVLAMVLQCRLHLCWSAPVTVSTVNASALEDDINSNATINGTIATLPTSSTSEEQGDEFADLQELRSGLKVLNTIAVSESSMKVWNVCMHWCCTSPTHPPTLLTACIINRTLLMIALILHSQKKQLALRLQLSDQGKTALDAVNNSTGIRLALSVTCTLRKTAEALDALPLALNSSALQSVNNNVTLLSVVTDALFKSACLWVSVSLFKKWYSKVYLLGFAHQKARSSNIVPFP